MNVLNVCFFVLVKLLILMNYFVVFIVLIFIGIGFALVIISHANKNLIRCMN